MIRFPYGISNFEQLVAGGYYYVDRTSYIARLESAHEPYQVFLRPRRFGKSLFTSTLHYYYGLQHKEKFQAIFGKYHAGQNPTPKASSYLVWSIQFSAIDTRTEETTFRDFHFKVSESALNFLAAYPAYFGEKEAREIKAMAAPQMIVSALLNMVDRLAEGRKVFVTIDEYDHFANELLAFHFSRFLETVGQNGFVRKFYEALKEGTLSGVLERIFITGVSPVTLDSLTSGFNISTNLTTKQEFNEMMGFTEQEVVAVLTQLDLEEERLDIVLNDLRQWYNGYLFHHKGRFTVYNPDMILYFLIHFQQYNEYPEDLLDENIASDYTKIRSMFRIKNKEDENLKVLTQIIEEGTVSAALIKKFSFEDEWTEEHFISLLFYLGILTIQQESMDTRIFRMPNYVIRRLYFQYFHQVILEAAHLHTDQINVREKLLALAQQNDIRPLVQLTENILSQLATEDRAHFSEQHVKAIFASLFYQVGYFNIFSELEVRKSPQEKGRIDLLLTRRPPYRPNFQFVFELKYLPKSQAHRQEEVQKSAVEQLKAYLAHDERLKSIEALKAYVLIFVAEKGTATAL